VQFLLTSKRSQRKIGSNGFLGFLFDGRVLF